MMAPQDARRGAIRGAVAARGRCCSCILLVSYPRRIARGAAHGGRQARSGHVQRRRPGGVPYRAVCPAAAMHACALHPANVLLRRRRCRHRCAPGLRLAQVWRHVGALALWLRPRRRCRSASASAALLGRSWRPKRVTATTADPWVQWVPHKVARARRGDSVRRVKSRTKPCHEVPGVSPPASCPHSPPQQAVSYEPASLGCCCCCVADSVPRAGKPGGGPRARRGDCSRAGFVPSMAPGRRSGIGLSLGLLRYVASWRGAWRRERERESALCAAAFKPAVCGNPGESCSFALGYSC